MERMDVAEWPDDMTMVGNGAEGGATWTRFTDGERDYMAMYVPETQEETLYRV